MNYNEKEVADCLLIASAVKINIAHPYTWASGWKSPIYCDNRKLLSFTNERDFIKKELCNVIIHKYPQAEAIAGVATAGIAWGAMAADYLRLPYMYVRPKPKAHGMENQIEGSYLPGQRVVVIEDLISTGKSSLQVCEVLKLAGMEVSGLVSIFNYGFILAADAFNNAGISYTSLTSYEILITQAIKKDIITENQLFTLLNWSRNPSEWKGKE